MPDAYRTEETEYKGNPTITVYTGHVYQGEEERISFGLRKARAIDGCIDQIRSWIDAQESGKPNRSSLKKQADAILRNAGENPEAVGAVDDDVPF